MCTGTDPAVASVLAAPLFSQTVIDSVSFSEMIVFLYPKNRQNAPLCKFVDIDWLYPYIFRNPIAGFIAPFWGDHNFSKDKETFHNGAHCIICE
jgi:hypothetical protein